MPTRLEIARRFLREQLDQRGDIIGARLVGSVARGEDTEGSDIDLGLFTEEPTGEGSRSLSTWRDGVFIEAGILAKKDYADFEKVMNDPYEATHVNDALILYDPTGFLSDLQKRVRAAYMEPRWLRVRLLYWLEKGREHCAGLRRAAAQEDLFEVCRGTGGVAWSLCSVALLRAGVTPSSSRSLMLLRKVSPLFTRLFCELEGPAELDQADVLALLRMAQRLPALAAVPSDWAVLAEYFQKKMAAMVSRGLHREALHTMWAE